MSSSSRSNQKAKVVNKPDFEGNLADLDAAFLLFVVESDPNFDITLLQSNNTPSLLMAPATTPKEDPYFPVSKQDLTRTIKISGPTTVHGNVFGDTVILEGNVRVKGQVYGVKQVQVGDSCVIEGDLVSDGPVAVGKGCRVEGSLIGADVELDGDLTVDGPVYSRSVLFCKGKLSAQSLTAGGNLVLIGEPGDVVTVEASLIMARHGEIKIDLPLKLAGRSVNVEQQKFYISRNEEQFRLSRSAFASEVEQGVLLTTLTDGELEKLVADLAVLEQ
jgi:cytoskeletal protein CcmA (bactofilin family)